MVVYLAPNLGPLLFLMQQIHLSTSMTCSPFEILSTESDMLFDEVLPAKCNVHCKRCVSTSMID